MKLVSMLLAAVAFMAPMMSFAAEAAGEMGEGRPLYAIAKALAIGLAALGGTLAQGMLVSSALEGISRNPGASDKVFLPFILGLAFVESLVIFALLIAFLIQA